MARRLDPKVARESGRCAALNGRPRICPYVMLDSPLRAAWLEGYDEADAQRRAATRGDDPSQPPPRSAI